MGALKIGQLVWQFAKELTEHAQDGMKNVDPVTYKSRIELCNGCPNLTEHSTCSLCGCFMPVKAKWATSRCPDDPPKWKRNEK